jgi:hypothetical protein
MGKHRPDELERFFHPCLRLPFCKVILVIGKGHGEERLVRNVHGGHADVWMGRKVTKYIDYG